MDHVNDCYFCLTPSMTKGFNRKKKFLIEYPDIVSAICPVPHSERLSIPEPCEIYLLCSDGAERSEESNISEPCTSGIPACISGNKEFGIITSLIFIY